MNFAKKYFYFFLVILLILTAGFFAQFYSQIKNFNYYTVAAISLYLISHFLRSLRFWFNISVARDVSIKNSIFINFTANSIGNLFFFIPFIKELLILVLSLCSGIKELGRIVFTIVYVRIFDLLFAAILLIMLYDSTDAEYSYALYLTFFIALLILLLLVFAYNIITAISDYFTKYYHNRFSLKIVECLSSVKIFLKKKKPYRPENILINIMLTIACWGFEMLAVTLLIKDKNNLIIETMNIVLNNVTVYFRHGIKAEMPVEYISLFFFLLLASLFVIIDKIRHEISRS